VVDDSPAAKAGLQKQDILIQAGDQPLTDLKTLVEKIEATQENALTVTFIRKGERQTVDVTPVKRPAQDPVAPDKETADEWKLLQHSLRSRWIPQIVEQGGTQPDGTKMLFVMPGFVLPEQAKDFPKDLEVTILKKGEEPAKITVKRGDEQWEVDANSLDKLPEDVRPHVTQMLGGGLSVTVGDGAFGLSSSLPQPLVLPKVTPDILKKSFKVAPQLRMELRGLTEKLPAEVRAKVDAHLKDAQEKLDEVQSSIPTETLDKIQQELKELREQIEKLRADRAEKAQKQAEAAGEPGDQ
jgi:membrane-associated protease RseP (regulator of RpoE activity)